ncbi:DnaD domain protein [Bacillus sp. APMAM]|nr:DnaD domain protein [Bacillus sp. APMAM]
MNDGEYIKVKECYEQSFGMITPFIMEELLKWIEDLSRDNVIEAMHRSVEKNKPWAYARKILKNWCK